jgi:hypothetical protein
MARTRRAADATLSERARCRQALFRRTVRRFHGAPVSTGHGPTDAEGLPRTIDDRLARMGTKTVETILSELSPEPRRHLA